MLSWGARFIPPQPLHVFNNVDAALEKFRTMLQWAHVAGFHPIHPTYKRFNVLRDREPPLMAPLVDAYFSGVAQKIDDHVRRAVEGHAFRRSFEMAEVEWLVKFCKERDVVVLQADKNLGLTALLRETYRALAMNHINATSKMVPDDSNTVARRIITNLVAALHAADANKNGVDPEVRHYLEKSLSEAELFIPDLYMLPKLHKTPIAGRPIVAAFKGAQSVASTWLAAVIHPVVERLPAFLQDAGHLIALLNDVHFDVSQDVFLTFDVDSMYPSLECETAVAALSFAIDLVYNGCPPTWKAIALRFARLLFADTYFQFEGQVWQQTAGIAMGTNAAPDIANAYLLPQELDLWRRPGVKIYKRFIDDGFAIVSGEDNARQILDTLRQSGLRFTSTISRTEAVFLDLHLYADHFTACTGLVSYATNRKALNRYLYMPPWSAHHPANVTAWIFAEILRLRNTCSSWERFIEQVSFFVDQLKLRGYHNHRIREALERLPATLLSPLVHRRPIPTPGPLVNNSGQVHVNKPPRILRAPYSARVPIPYGTIAREGLDPVINFLDQRAAEANPYPPPSPNPNPTLHGRRSAPPPLTMAVTHPPSLSALLQRKLL